MGLFGKNNSEEEQEEQEEEEEVETYEYNYACDNCGYEDDIFEIPKGTLTTDFLEKADVCVNCGCKLYNPSSKITK